MDRIDAERLDGTAALLEQRCHSWADELVDLFGDGAGDELVQRYVEYAVARVGSTEAKKRKRALLSTASDGALGVPERVRLLLERIGGDLGDISYLRGLDGRIARWREARTPE